MIPPTLANQSLLAVANQSRYQAEKTNVLPSTTVDEFEEVPLGNKTIQAHLTPAKSKATLPKSYGFKNQPRGIGLIYSTMQHIFSALDAPRRAANFVELKGKHLTSQSHAESGGRMRTFVGGCLQISAGITRLSTPILGTLACIVGGPVGWSIGLSLITTFIIQEVSQQCYNFVSPIFALCWPRTIQITPLQTPRAMNNFWSGLKAIGSACNPIANR